MKNLLLASLLMGPLYALGQWEASNDVDSDGCVGVNDVLSILAHFGECEPFGPASSVVHGDSVVYNGFTYATVIIGTQEWMKENLKTTTYSNGDLIDGNGWSEATLLATSQGAQTSYNLDNSNVDLYGRLYNWHAVIDSRGLCPQGWRVPTEHDIDTLLLTVASGPDSKIKASPSDEPVSWNGTNTTGLTIIPAGHLGLYSTFTAMGSEARFYTQSFWGTTVTLARGFQLTSNSFDEFAVNFNRFYSIRCLRDAE